jgi:uncharacterized membrane protein YgcG
MKYIPWCLLGLFMLFGQIVPVLIYCLLGYYQVMVRKQSFIRLPVSIYRKVDALMLNSVKEGPGYIKVTTVEANLRRVCLTNGCCDWGQEEESRPFARNDVIEGGSEGGAGQAGGRARVDVIGGGVSIGGGAGSYQVQNQAQNFKSYWQDKEQ